MQTGTVGIEAAVFAAPVGFCYGLVPRLAALLLHNHAANRDYFLQAEYKYSISWIQQERDIFPFFHDLGSEHISSQVCKIELLSIAYNHMEQRMVD